MDNRELYNLIEEGQVNVPSEMGIILSENVKSITYEEVLEKLKASNIFQEVRLLKNGNEIVGNIIYEDVNYEIKIYIGGKIVEETDIETLSAVNALTEEEWGKLKKSNVNIVTLMRFADRADTSYLVQLKVLDAISKDYVAVIDASAEKVISSKWVKMTLKDNIEPLSSYLFTIHAVYSEEKDGSKKYWFHTHGLNRCGCIELEMLDISEEAENHYHVLNTIASRFVEEGVTKRRIPIQGGYASNIYLNYTWIPWEEGINMYKSKGIFRKKDNLLGGLNDRDEYHKQPSGVIFAIHDNKIEKVSKYNTLFHNNPIFFVTNRESEKMALLAQKRFNYLKEVFNKEEKPRENGYIFKAGLITDDARDEFDREHLWFELKEIKEDYLIGELINDAYRISDLVNGDIYEVPLSSISDWAIYTKEGKYVPDNIYKIFQD